MSRHQHLALLSIPILGLAGQLLTGTDLNVAVLFTAGLFFGMYSVPAAGGLRSPAGMLNAMLVAKFLLIAIAIKLVTLAPSDEGLLAPLATAGVMALGFAGLFAGSLMQRHLPSLQGVGVPGIHDPRMYGALSIIVLIFGYGGLAFSMAPELSGESLQTGGAFGVARVMSSFKSFAIVPALYYVWLLGSRRFMTHPLVLSILTVQLIAGVFTTGKADAMEPLAFYFFVGVLRYGFLDKRLWALAATAVFYYVVIVSPYSQYVRVHGGRQGSGEDRMEAMTTVLWQMATDEDFRQMVNARVRPYGNTYLREEWQPFARFAMVGEADRLIAATEQQEAFTGWETITWGFQLMMPSFLFPDKPVWGTSNYLAHIAGDVNETDMTTQVAYGVMANLYNAFSFGGVFFGSLIFFAVFYYLLRNWFCNPGWTSSPAGATIWYLLIVASFGHSLVEQSVAGLIAAVPATLVVVLVFVIAARYISSFFPGYVVRI